MKNKIESDPQSVIQDIERKYDLYNQQTGKEPQYLRCNIAFNDAPETKIEVKIGLSHGVPENKTEGYFHYCGSLESLKELCLPNQEDFVIVTCHYFHHESDTVPHCTECGKTLEKGGFCIWNGKKHYCSKTCLYKHYSPQEWETMHGNGDTGCYYFQL